nr:5'-nucleotidase C-terminal domain-containing protein [uncultured Actinotalea sp.]
MQPSRRLTGRLVPLATAGTLAASVMVAAPAAANDHLVEIDILGINDFHGRIEAGGQSAGAASLAGAVAAFRADNANTLFVSAGDNIGASTFTSFVADDVPTIDVLNEMGLDVAALGNHEFDRGRTDVDDRLVGPAALTEFPYLAANIYEAGTTTPAYDPYEIFDVDGVDVAFVGAMTEALPSLVSPSGIATLDIGPIAPAVNAVAEQLTDGDTANDEADVVVLLVHEGPPSADQAAVTGANVFGDMLGDLSADVSAVFSGHTHFPFAYQIPVEGWAEGLNRPVVMAGQYGERLAHVTLTVNRDTGDLVGTESEVVDLVTGDPATPVYPTVQAVTDIVSAAVAEAAVLGGVSLGNISADLKRAQQPTGSENRGGESTLGNLVADVQLWATQGVGTEIAFMNPGGLRADLLYASSGEGDPAGNVTYREAATVQSFANTLVALTLTGAQVVDVLEEQWQPTGAARPFLKLGVAGLTYTYDPTAPAGERITEVWVGDTALDLEAEYRVVANSFLASGGDNFTTLGEGTDTADTGRVDLQAFVDYMAEFGTGGDVVSPDLVQRAVGVDGPASAYPGGLATVNLSSLLFSAGEDQGDEPEVEVSVGGAVVDTAVIDPTPVTASDEVGRATVTVPVPADAVGEVVVEVSVPATGTATSFAIPVATETGLVSSTPVRAATPAVVQPGEAQCLQVAGEYGVPAGATGVVVNVTTVNPAGDGHVVLYPAGSPVPNGSTVNFETGRDVANAAFVALSDDGRLCFLTRGAEAQVLIDVAGFMAPGSGFETQAAQRIVDTRTPPIGDIRGPVRPRTEYTVDVLGVGGVPADATAVLVNVTIDGATGPGNLRVYPAGGEVPDASTVNYAPGMDKANAAIVAVGEDGAIAFWSDTDLPTSFNPVQVIIDVVGWTTDTAGYTEVAPFRVADTREDDAPLAAGETLSLDFTDLAAELAPGATAVVLNVTAIKPDTLGNLRVYPDVDGEGTTEPPFASSLNYIVGRDIANLVVVQLPANGQVAFYTDMAPWGTVDVAVDVLGFIGGDVG